MFEFYVFIGYFGRSQTLITAVPHRCARKLRLTLLLAPSEKVWDSLDFKCTTGLRQYHLNFEVVTSMTFGCSLKLSNKFFNFLLLQTTSSLLKLKGELLQCQTTLIRQRQIGIYVIHFLNFHFFKFESFPKKSKKQYLGESFHQMNVASNFLTTF